MPSTRSSRRSHSQEQIRPDTMQPFREVQDKKGLNAFAHDIHVPCHVQI